MDELIVRFQERAEAAMSTLHRFPQWTEVATLAEELAAGGRVAVAPSVAAEAPELLDRLGSRTIVPDASDPALPVADLAAGIVRGELAVAETGSVLVAEDRLADRTVSMLSRALIQVVDARNVVASLDDVARWLTERCRRRGYTALSTGPSRTADIERTLTIGVQGPTQVHVVIRG